CGSRARPREGKARLDSEDGRLEGGAGGRDRRRPPAGIKPSLFPRTSRAGRRKFCIRIIARMAYLERAVHRVNLRPASPPDADLFANTLVERVEARCAIENTGSQRVLEKNGFRREGLLRGYFKLRGRRVDNFLYALLRDDYFARGRQG